jgi:hypothetical protein
LASNADFFAASDGNKSRFQMPMNAADFHHEIGSQKDMTKHTRIRYLLYQVSKQKKKHSCQMKQALGKKKIDFLLYF